MLFGFKSCVSASQTPVPHVKASPHKPYQDPWSQHVICTKSQQANRNSPVIVPRPLQCVDQLALLGCPHARDPDFCRKRCTHFQVLVCCDSCQEMCHLAFRELCLFPSHTPPPWITTCTTLYHETNMLYYTVYYTALGAGVNHCWQG